MINKEEILKNEYNVTFVNSDMLAVICPICQIKLVRSKAGLHHHFGRHIKDGSITIEDRIFLLQTTLRLGRKNYTA